MGSILKTLQYGGGGGGISTGGNARMKFYQG